MSLNVVFMGSSDFSTKILEVLAKHFSICGVITQPDRPTGRGNVVTPPAVKILASKLNLSVQQPEKLKLPESFEQLASLNPDVIVVAAYGQILRQNVLSLPRYGCINVHASLLPRWRGASPIQAAILHGDLVSGATIMKMDAGVDTGPVLARATLEITPGETSRSLSEKLALLGGDLLIDSLSRYIDGFLQPVPQDENGATYAPIIDKKDGLLDFNVSAEQLERKVRAFIDWPGTYMYWEEQTLKIRSVQVKPMAGGIPGRRSIQNGYPSVTTVDGDLILLEVQPAGKKWMDGRDFLRGARYWQQN